jgi:hypothetical protein
LDGRNIAVTEARPVDERPQGQIGHGFEVYQNIEQRAARNSKGGGGGRHRGKGRFMPSR